MAFENFDDLDAGDETRRNGDYVGFPHGVSDGTAVDSASPAEGVPVTYDQSADALAAVTDLTGTTDVAGVIFAYPVYGDSSSGPYVDGDKNATVKTSGTVVVDFSGVTTSTGTGVTEANEGVAEGPNGELYVINVFDPSNDLAEVLVR